MNNKEYSDLVESGNFPEEIKVPIDDIFKDNRGEIINLLFSSIKSVAIITSKTGSVRSNHWHRSSWHYLYVLEGSMKYCERNLDGSGVKEMLCQKGDFIFTGPGKVHKTDFLTDCILLSLGKDPKDHLHHEEDLVREQF